MSLTYGFEKFSVENIQPYYPYCFHPNAIVDFIIAKSEFFLYPILFKFKNFYLAIGLINALFFAATKNSFAATQMTTETSSNKKGEIINEI